MEGTGIIMAQPIEDSIDADKLQIDLDNCHEKLIYLSQKLREAQNKLDDKEDASDLNSGPEFETDTSAEAETETETQADTDRDVVTAKKSTGSFILEGPYKTESEFKETSKGHLAKFLLENLSEEVLIEHFGAPHSWKQLAKRNSKDRLWEVYKNYFIKPSLEPAENDPDPAAAARQKRDARRTMQQKKGRRFARGGGAVVAAAAAAAGPSLEKRVIRRKSTKKKATKKKATKKKASKKKATKKKASKKKASKKKASKKKATKKKATKN